MVDMSGQSRDRLAALKRAKNGSLALFEQDNKSSGQNWAKNVQKMAIFGDFRPTTTTIVVVVGRKSSFFGKNDQFLENFLRKWFKNRKFAFLKNVNAIAF